MRNGQQNIVLKMRYENVKKAYERAAKHSNEKTGTKIVVDILNRFCDEKEGISV